MTFWDVLVGAWMAVRPILGLLWVGWGIVITVLAVLAGAYVPAATTAVCVVIMAALLLSGRHR